jgi:hypothetical protein
MTARLLPWVVAAIALSCAMSVDAAQEQDTIELGQHWRIESELGPIHVWQPAGYDARTAGTVVYIHGYGMAADDVWSEHALARQFAASGKNALFLVPEAPQSNEEHVHFTRLDELFAVLRSAGVEIPRGPLAVVGHSGGFRTILTWLGDRRLHEIILLDAVYGRDAPFRAWLRPVKGQTAKKLVIVGADTARKSERLARAYKGAVRRVGIPEDAMGFTRRELNAPILYMRSQYEHMQIVLSGRVLPVLLRLTSVAAVAD